jgi:uncharacterized protein YbjQ (UPF0145 family)
MVTTTFEFEGWRTVKYYGVVRGICVRSRSIVGSTIGALRTIIGGNIKEFKELCEGARRDAFQEMMVHAEELGANAIIGMRYDANEVMSGVTEVLAYGTAVGLEKITPEDTRGDIGAEDVLRDA